MKYLLLGIFFISSLLFAGTQTDKKINKTNSKLNSYSKNYANINKKMQSNAKAILKQKRQLYKQIKYLDKLKKELFSKEVNYDENIKQLQALKKSQKVLKEKQNKLEEKLVFVIAKSVSLSIVLEEKYPENKESLIQVEVLKTMLKFSQDKVKELSKIFFENQKSIGLLESHANILETSISDIDKKRKKLTKTTKANKLALRKLQKDKASY